MQITKLTYNWFQTGDLESGLGEDFDVAEVGKVDTFNKKTVSKIHWRDTNSTPHCIIFYTDDSMMNVFNPNTITFSH